MRLLACPELGRLQLLQVELLALSDQLLTLVLQPLALSLHSGLQFLKVTQLDLQFLHLRLNEQRHQGLDLALLQCGQMLRLNGCRCQSCRRRRLHVVLAEGSILRHRSRSYCRGSRSLLGLGAVLGLAVATAVLRLDVHIASTGAR